MKRQDDLLTLLSLLADKQTVTFVYAAHDEERNSAVALKQYLETTRDLETTRGE